MTVICPNCGVRHGETRDQYAAILNSVSLRSSQRRVLEVVAKGRGELVRVADMVDYAFADREDGGPLEARRSVHSAIHATNKAIEPFGWRLENEYGRGYRLVQFVPNMEEAN